MKKNRPTWNYTCHLALVAVQYTPSSPLPVNRMTKFDAIRIKAKELQNQTSIYGVKGVYGTLDGAVNAYSVFKSYFDYTHATESQIASFDAMHEWITTPIGLATTLVSSLGFMIFANQANIKEKSTIGKTWKVGREGAQASRNAFKGFRSSILTAELFSPRNLHYLILPTSLGLGSVYVVNRIIMLYVNDARKDLIKKNNEVFEHIMRYGTFLECKHSTTKSQLEQNAKNYLGQCVYLEDEKRFVQVDKRSAEINPIENRYILYKQPGKKEQLHFVTYKSDKEKYAASELIAKANIAAIREALAKNNVRHLSLLQLNELLPPGVAISHFNLLKKQKINTAQLIKNTAYNQNAAYYLLKAFNGLVDGLYLYISIISLVPLCPQALLFAVALSILYCVLCIIQRLYEEYQTEQNVRVSEYKIALAAAGKELELCLLELNKIAILIQQETNKNIQDKHILERLKGDQKAADEALEKQLKNFQAARKMLRAENKVTNLTCVLLGIKHGLPFYGVVLSALFTAAFICFLCSTPIAPMAVLIIIAAGIPILLATIAHAFLTRKKNAPDETPEQEKENTANIGKVIAQVKASFNLTRKDASEAEEVDRIRARAKNSFLDWITLSIQADALLDTYYSEGAEVFRSLWAGILKGKKEAEFLFNSLQTPDAQGHYQDSMLMYFIIIPLALIYAVSFALKAFAKGFSRTLNNKENYADQVLKDPKLDEEKTFKPNEKNKKTLTLGLSDNLNSHISIKILSHASDASEKINKSESTAGDITESHIHIRTKHSKIEVNSTKGLTTFSLFSPANPHQSESGSHRKLKITHVSGKDASHLPSSTQHPDVIAGSNFYHCTF